MRNILHGQRYYFFLIHSKKTSNRPYVQFLSSLVEKERRVNSPIPAGHIVGRHGPKASHRQHTHAQRAGERPAAALSTRCCPKSCALEARNWTATGKATALPAKSSMAVRKRRP